MKRLSLLITAILATMISINARTVQGIVLCAKDSMSASDANCRLMSDGKLISESIADSHGAFSMETDLKTTLNLDISLPGYAMSTIVIGAGSKNINADVIYLEEARELNEVTVIPGKYLSGHYVGKYENGDALQFEWQPDKHWTFGASWMYMFDKKGTQYPSWNYSSVNPSSRERYIKNNANMVVISVSYTTDFGTFSAPAHATLRTLTAVSRFSPYEISEYGFLCK